MAKEGQASKLDTQLKITIANVKFLIFGRTVHHLCTKIDVMFYILSQNLNQYHDYVLEMTL